MDVPALSFVLDYPGCDRPIRLLHVGTIRRSAEARPPDGASFVGMGVRSLGMFVRKLAMFLSSLRMMLRLVVLTPLVVVLCLVVVMRGRMVMTCGGLVMLARRMFRHLNVLPVMSNWIKTEVQSSFPC
jgi:hypothetical protein